MDLTFLNVQARCISNVKADTDHTSFLAGTQSLKEENEVHTSGLLYVLMHFKDTDFYSFCRYIWSGFRQVEMNCSVKACFRTLMRSGTFRPVLLINGSFQLSTPLVIALLNHCWYALMINTWFVFCWVIIIYQCIVFYSHYISWSCRLALTSHISHTSSLLFGCSQLNVNEWILNPHKLVNMLAYMRRTRVIMLETLGAIHSVRTAIRVNIGPKEKKFWMIVRIIYVSSLGIWVLDECNPIIVVLLMPD